MFSDPIWGLIAPLVFMLLVVIVVCAYCIISNCQKIRALEIMKELAAMGVDLGKSTDVNEGDE